ncbi:MAG TPA: class I SAM-dependent methyltransferase [Methanocella sp.]|nr:class I SAM-dependent methyltransferase [Methanocella sp.]
MEKPLANKDPAHSSRSEKPSTMAERVAIIRALESLKPEGERICYDPYAACFIDQAMIGYVSGIPGGAKAILDRVNARLPGIPGSLVARVRYFDDFVKASISGGIEQLVILGAGYDTRAYRIEELKKLRVFEVDHPGTQPAKVQKIREIFGSLPGHVAYVPMDFEVDDLGQKLMAQGYSRSKKTLFVLEGLVMYLLPKVVDETLSFIAHNSAGGSTVIFDYGYAHANGAGSGKAAQNLHDYVADQGEPIKFGIPKGTTEAFLTQRGFTKVRNVTRENYRQLYFHGKNEGRKITGLCFVSAEVPANLLTFSP